MKNLSLLFLITITFIYNYDKYLNRDYSTLILRTTETPFYSSSHLYSSHYAKLNININITKK